MHHELKIHRPFFEAVASGDKTFEIRNNRDRGFQRGDTFELQELNPAFPSLYSGRSLTGTITYVINYEQKPDYVVFAFRLDEASKEVGHE
ncbi:TPA: DUF3850 domain-containing protein [Pseudomonas aeruginosa]|uniref:DUF3850 domain-containing protein n=1 Tax=Pseudomonas aeruginosa TaxID=287 RepID=UPI0003D3076F|nr:DUF3850 domain-containing protein [Pseudomonas aeruginosa]ETD94635.1 RNA-binding protein [Pseudomonas aeruginosa VRFPA06]MBG4431632.1 DUF3850 domain-containing protein [Pseudomonas aeruginosa]MBG4473703.1 DUF3850 domain-containing protein [Pseudomonas aeruginosa]MBO8290097.1 DUF3850 domain-containing protein [Pseudomonas aeruginosa]MBR7200995.1 DUF3850 domain-containing protein [Pseudomonas aeruginosa]